jgi:hypothetical protein
MSEKKHREQLENLMQAINEDPLIRNRISELLKMEPPQRRNVLDAWLEQLRLMNASEALLSALSLLKEDRMVKRMTALSKWSKPTDIGKS